MIDKNVRVASTPPGWFYNSEEIFAKSIDKIFARTWHVIDYRQKFQEDNMLFPHVLLPGSLHEPIIISKVAGEFQLLSNVCTHRGFILIEEPVKTGTIRCRYHGRCFNAHGDFISMPEFEAAENFPTRMDNLAKVPFVQWQGFLFASVFPKVDFSEVIQDIDNRLGWFPFDKLQYKEELSHTYHIHANWALYCDNYLEGFHIPFVHKSLNKVIDYGNYETHLFKYCNLQTGIAKDNDLIFDLPSSSPDYGKKIAAYYYWIFPNMMLNFYPWGLSLNIVEPQSVNETKVIFKTYIFDESKYNQGAGSDLHRVEMEDEEVVESVHRGLQSRFYHRGRYSPKMEKGVHHFHLLMQEFLEMKTL